MDRGCLCNNSTGGVDGQLLYIMLMLARRVCSPVN